jgi:U3 small nucleolar RNA-associated protein MPP10
MPKIFFINFREQNDLSEKIKKTVKCSYDFLKQNEDDSQLNEALPELIIKDFDDEQIWQELELQNEPTVNNFVENISSFLTEKSKSLLTFLEHTETEPTELESDSESSTDDDANSEEVGSSDEGNSDFELKSGEKSGADAVIDWDDEDSEGELGDFLDMEAEEGEEEESDVEEEETFETRKGESSRKNPKKSEVDDGFFSLAAMAEFLDQEDAREEKKYRRQKQMDEGEDNDEELDLFTGTSKEDEVNC